MGSSFSGQYQNNPQYNQQQFYINKNIQYQNQNSPNLNQYQKKRPNQREQNSQYNQQNYGIIIGQQGKGHNNHGNVGKINSGGSYNNQSIGNISTSDAQNSSKNGIPPFVTQNYNKPDNISVSSKESGYNNHLERKSSQKSLSIHSKDGDNLSSYSGSSKMNNQNSNNVNHKSGGQNKRGGVNNQVFNKNQNNNPNLINNANINNMQKNQFGVDQRAHMPIITRIGDGRGKNIRRPLLK